MPSTTLFQLLLTAAAAATPALAFCGSHTYHDVKRRQDEVTVADFGYSGTTGPTMWSSIDPLYSACSTGTNQSPINLVDGVYTTKAGDSISINLPSVPSGAEFQNKGSTVEVVMEELGGSLVLDGNNYTLSQFHFHNPSEHEVDGVSMPMEMHMVFQYTEVEPFLTAVVGIFVDLDAGTTALAGRVAISAASDMLETVFASVDDIATPGTSTTTAAFDLSEVQSLVEAGTLKSYSGSLTTPPCSEDVSWMVLDSTLSISVASYSNARQVIGFNSRFPQNAPGETNLLELACSQ